MVKLSDFLPKMSKKPQPEALKLQEEAPKAPEIAPISAISEPKQELSPNHHIPTDEERALAAKEKRLKAEMRRLKATRAEYIEKLKDEIEIKKLQGKLKGDDDGSSWEDDLLKALVPLVLANRAPNVAAVLNQAQAKTEDTGLQDFEKQIEANAAAAPVADTGLDPGDEGLLEGELDIDLEDTRYTDEQIKALIPSLLSPKQIEAIQGLTPAEILQIHSVLKKKQL